MYAETSEYKGHPVITLKNKKEDKYGFSFGRRKAEMILESIEEIKKFVEQAEIQEMINSI